jgi:BON domain
MKDDSYIAGQIERALLEDGGTQEPGVRVEVDGDTVVLRGQVASVARRQLAARVAAAAAPGMTVRNEVGVTEPSASAPTPEIPPLPEEVRPVREVLPPQSFSGGTATGTLSS